MYLAIQKSIDREVAVKVMSPRLSQDPSFGSRFYREAKIVGQLSHPNIVSIYDVGSYKHYNYIAMDFLPGKLLEDRIREGLPVHEALRIAREVAGALDYAHQRGYIHRDIKPDNILFRDDGSSVLSDFGIAKALKGDMKMTSVGAVLGTPYYMSPEQAQDKPLDGRADIYALGVVLYEMLTGMLPFPGEDPVAVAVKHISTPIPRLPSQLRYLQGLINKLLAKTPAERYQTGQEVVNAIEMLEQQLTPGKIATNGESADGEQLHLLSKALFSALLTTLTLKIRRLVSSRNGHSIAPADDQQQADLDNFVLADEQDEIETATNPAVPAPRRKSRAWFYLPAGGLAIAIAAFIAVYEWQPQLAKQIAAPLLSPTPDITVRNIEMDAPPQKTSAKTAPTAEDLPVSKAAPLKPEKTLRYKLRIEMTPDDATVRILNIKPRYQADMLLERGSYHIEVSATDYHSESFWLRLKDADVVKVISLKPTRRLLDPGTVLTDTLASGDNGPAMVVLPRTGVDPLSGESSELDPPIAMSTQELSFADYALYADATGKAMPDDEGWGRKKRPVIGLSYENATAYARWLSDQTGQIYRLPTLSEWRFAAAAGSNKQFWWGDGAADKRANCRRGCDSQWSGLFSSKTAPVGSFAANPYGIYDTAGNVAEWVAPCVETVQGNCHKAKVAGGSHADKINGLATTGNATIDATQGYKTVGVRLVLEL